MATPRDSRPIKTTMIRVQDRLPDEFISAVWKRVYADHPVDSNHHVIIYLNPELEDIFVAKSFVRSLQLRRFPTEFIGHRVYDASWVQNEPNDNYVSIKLETK